MKRKRAKTRRNIERAERHGYFSEGKMRKEIIKEQAIEKEAEEELSELKK